MLVVPYLRGSLNTTFPHDASFTPVLSQTFGRQKLPTLRRVTLQSTEDGFLADQPKHQGSGNIDSLSSADGLTLLNQDNQEKQEN